MVMASFPDFYFARRLEDEDDTGGEQPTLSPSQLMWLPEPQEVTDWLVEIRLNGSAPCPLGFVCDGERMANCTKIRAVALSYGFGDVHAGGYCPEGKDGLKVCPIGSFCPTAELEFPCPEGKFCPYKTFLPSIPCSKCDQGAEELAREWYGYFLVAAMFALALIWILLGRVGNYRANLVAQFVDLSSRSLDSARSLYRRNQRIKELERLKPKLFAIQKRVELLQQGSDTSSNITTSTSSSKSSNAGLSIQDSGKVYYNAGQLFDALDKDKNAILDFEELQHVLELNPEQLQAFMSRMNELSGQSNNATSVSRAVFVKHFLRVLEETSNFGPTQGEVEDLFEELADGKDVAQYVDFFDSRLSLFLSDPQINNMIAEFRKYASMEEGAKKKRGSNFGVPQSSGDVAASNLTMAETGMKASRKSMGRPHLGASASSKKFSVANLFAPQDAKDAKRVIHRDVFCKYYAEVLSLVTQDPKPDGDDGDAVVKAKGVDLAFEDLSLAVSVGGKEVNVVNSVSGRLPASTMTALMGGSGAGKTSLLNALCGRAFYGTTKGTIRINGHVTTIEEHKSCTGFVPQDDIVHAELTVKENLIYSGRFSLAKGTTIQEIEDYADTVLAYLGLSRVANSIVGDVNRRGVSGGEKKRVNIGVELMAKPSILFLDEPTSGLDSSSALLVMGSLKKLVQSQGVTVLSVIHQPRKAIFESFDSLVLLGVGGNMVYHGPVSTAQAYFENLPQPYLLPPGESLADWLIDVSSGTLTPNERQVGSGKSKKDGKAEMMSEGKVLGETVDDAISSRGPSTAKFEHSLEKAKERRQALYECWNAYYKTRSPEELERYTPPNPYDLPQPFAKPGFFTQLAGQIERNFLMMWRNRTTKLIETTLIVGTVVAIAFVGGTLKITTDTAPNLTFDELVQGDPYDIAATFPELFLYAIRSTRSLLEFAIQTGVITSVLLGLTAAKTLTSKRLEFFRESGSGWDINAYFLAVNITSTLEHLVQMVIAASCAFWIRNSLTTWFAYTVQFIMLMWITVAWSFLIPLLVPPNSTILAVGFFMAFFGLLCSGAIDPVTYHDIYDEGNDGLAIFSGIFSVTRYFIEGMMVQEQRCLTAQSGFTVEPPSVYFPIDQVGSFHLISLAQNDLSVVQISCTGWFWGVLPAFLVGFSIRILAAGVLHVSDRSRQNKKSLWSELQKKPLARNRTVHVVIGFMVVVLTMFAISAWVIVTPRGSTGLLDPPKTEEEALALLNTTLEQIQPGLELPAEWNMTDLNMTALNGTDFNVTDLPNVTDVNITDLIGG